MATRTSARPRSRPSPGAKPRGSSSRARAAPARRSKKRKGLLGWLLALFFRLLGQLWMLLATGLGTTLRALGSGARELKLDRAHRRDGIALALLAAASVLVAAVWFDAGGPAGARLATGVRGLVGGLGAAVVPVVLIGFTWRLVRHPPGPPGTRGRLLIGWTALAAGVTRPGSSRERRPGALRRRRADARGGRPAGLLGVLPAGDRCHDLPGGAAARPPSDLRHPGRDGDAAGVDPGPVTRSFGSGPVAGRAVPAPRSGP